MRSHWQCQNCRKKIAQQHMVLWALWNSMEDNWSAPSSNASERIFADQECFVTHEKNFADQK